MLAEGQSPSHVARVLQVGRSKLYLALEAVASANVA